ncbi:hypothetical protein IWW38_002564, partial [Coemansia aciculifera]
KSRWDRSQAAEVIVVPVSSEASPDSETAPKHLDPPTSEPPQRPSAPSERTSDADADHSDSHLMSAEGSTHIVITEATGVETEANSGYFVDTSGMDTSAYANSDYQPSGRQSSADGNHQRLQDKIYVEVESTRGFNVRAKLIGTGGENMKYIQNTTGARVQVRGNGSGCEDSAVDSDPYEPMHLYITATSEDALNQAKGYCSSLVETLHAQFYEFKDVGSRRYEPTSNPRDSRDYDRDRYQSSRYRNDRQYTGRSQQPYYPSRQEYPPQHEYPSQHAYPPAYQQQGYSQQGYLQHGYPQAHRQTAPGGTADAAAYDEYAKYYAQYYQYYGTYPDQSAYHGQAGYSTAQPPAYPASEQYAHDAYTQSQPQHPSAAAANSGDYHNEKSPSGYHNVPPPVDYSNKKV